MEYKKFAQYYDQFYKNKNYVGEVQFLLNFITKKDKVLDVGCGTGIHASLLEKNGIAVDGVDMNLEMLNVAKTRLHSKLYLQDILDLDIPKKYDVIISMFAVINHLKDTLELEQCFRNLKDILTDQGKIIIDLHNPQKSGKKTDTFDNMSRTMEWHYDKNTKIEESKITFSIADTQYIDHHTFRIFTIEEVKQCCQNVGLYVKEVYENYDVDKCGTASSKNLQFVIMKEVFKEMD